MLGQPAKPPEAAASHRGRHRRPARAATACATEAASQASHPSRRQADTAAYKARDDA